MPIRYENLFKVATNYTNYFFRKFVKIRVIRGDSMKTTWLSQES
jgi:hypothetical protein